MINHFRELFSLKTTERFGPELSSFLSIFIVEVGI